MSACCRSSSRRVSPQGLSRVGEVLALVVSSTIFLLVPKCPACFAAYAVLWVGVGLTLSQAAALRVAMLVLGATLLACFVASRLIRLSFFWNPCKPESKP